EPLDRPRLVTARLIVCLKPEGCRLCLPSGAVCGSAPTGRGPGGPSPRPLGRGGNRDEVLSPGVEKGPCVGVSEEVDREEEPRMHGLADQAHPRLLQQPVTLAQAALEAGGNDVRPGRLPAPRPRQHVVDGQAIAAPVTVLARIPVAPEDVLLVEGHTVAE